MKKIINTAILALVALFMTYSAQAQTAAPAPTPEKIDLSKEGDTKAIQFSLKLSETKKFVLQLPKDKYLWVYFGDPSLDNATNPLKQVDSSQTSFAGVNGTRAGDRGGVSAGFIWELTGAADKKIFTSSNVIKVDSPQIPADGEYYLTINCTTGACNDWLRIKVDNTAAPQTATVDFP